MKKTIAVLLAVLLLVTLAACSGTGSKPGNGPGDTTAQAPTEQTPAEPQKIADDTTALGLVFTPPEGYADVNRHFEYAADGSLVDKSLSYRFADKSEVMIGATKGKQITDEIPQSYLDKAEVVEYGGKSFYVVTQGNNVMAVCQDNDVAYGLGWSFADALDRGKFDALMDGISFTDNTDTVENGDDLFDITYTPDSSLNAVTVMNNLTETPDGETVDKAITRYYGADKDNIDFRLLVKVTKNTTVEEVIPKFDTAKELERDGVTYTAVYNTNDGERPYAYFTQRGNDVYEIRNMGTGSSWSVTRSDASYEALEKLMSTVSFADSN